MAPPALPSATAAVLKLTGAALAALPDLDSFGPLSLVGRAATFAWNAVLGKIENALKMKLRLKFIPLVAVAVANVAADCPDYTTYSQVRLGYFSTRGEGGGAVGARQRVCASRGLDAG